MSSRELEYWHVDDTCTVMIEHIESVAFVHVELKIWNVAMQRKLDVLLDRLKTKLKNEGHILLFAYNKCEDEQWYRFVKMFGFTKSFVHGGMTVYQTGLA